MARPRTPTKVLDARGAFKRHPERKRGGEPEVRDPLGAPPEDLSPAELRWWHEFAARAPVGVLTAADWPILLMASKLMAEFMFDSTAMNAGRLGRLQSLLGTFGMTPSDRAKLSIPKARDDDNPYAALD